MVRKRGALLQEKMERKFLVLLRRKMSQGDICRKLDMDRSYMSAIENGKKNITIQQLERLAQALGVSY